MHIPIIHFPQHRRVDKAVQHESILHLSDAHNRRSLPSTAAVLTYPQQRLSDHIALFRKPRLCPSPASQRREISVRRRTTVIKIVKEIFEIPEHDIKLGTHLRPRNKQRYQDNEEPEDTFPETYIFQQSHHFVSGTGHIPVNRANVGRISEID